MLRRSVKMPFNPIAGFATLALLAMGVGCGDENSSTPLAGSAALSGSAAATPPGAPPGDPQAVTGLAREGASLAVSSDGARLYLADEDGAKLHIMGLPLDASAKPTSTDPGGRPAQVAVVGSTVLATVRMTKEGTGALVVYEEKLGDLVEAARIALPRDAWGVATSPDGKRAAVTSAWTAQVSLIDLEQKKLVWSRDVPREPRGVTFSADGSSVYVSHLVGANLTRIDDVGNQPRVVAVELPTAPARSPAAEKLPASLGYALVTNPERDRLYAPRHALGGLGMNQWYGVATVDVLDMTDSKPLAAPRQVNAHKTFIKPFMERFDTRVQISLWSAASDVVTVGASVFTQPRAAVYRPTQGTLLVASEGSGAVVELDASMSDPTLGLVRSYGVSASSSAAVPDGIACGAASGIALAADDGTAYVHCRATDLVVAVLLPQTPGDYDSPPPRYVRFAEPSSNADYAMGRQLFYQANDQYVSGGLGCAGCHPDGRDDGFVWHEVEFAPKEGTQGATFTNFFGSGSLARSMAAFWNSSPIKNGNETGVGYTRQTPIIAGRLKSKGPYGWRAENKTLDSRLLAGFDLHRWNESGNKDSAFPPTRARQLIAFVREGLVSPPLDPAPLNAEETRGKEIFTSEKVGCSTCHVPETDYTNRSVAVFSAFPQRGYFEEKGASYKTPSLLFVGGSAPYFHDGRFATLEDVVFKNGDQMGKTSQLDASEKKALVAFLRRL